MIDTNSDDWYVFAGNFAVMEGFAPNPRDERVFRLWTYFRGGVAWGKRTTPAKTQQCKCGPSEACSVCTPEDSKPKAGSLCVLKHNYLCDHLCSLWGCRYNFNRNLENHGSAEHDDK
jgi:hypothetical protein